MLRKAFESELGQLERSLRALASMVETNVLSSVRALVRMDGVLAQRLVDNDVRVNARRLEIESGLLTLIATQGPIARDLRRVAAFLEINTELERIGDYAKGNARIVLMIARAGSAPTIPGIAKMADHAMAMLRGALDAFLCADVDAALRIAAEDDQVDAMYEGIYRQLLSKILQDPRHIEQATHLLWIAHNLERAADRVTNICERTLFAVTGEMRELDTVAAGAPTVATR